MSVDLATLALKVEALEVDAASRKLDNLTAAGGRTEKAAGGMSAAFRALGAALSAVQLANMIKESALMAARYETMGAAMVTVGNNAGYTGAQMAEYEKRLRATGIAMIESRETLTKMAASNIDLAKATDLARIAQDAAVVGNINSSEAFDRMINGIRSAEVEVLRGIGLNVNFEQSYAKLADQLGKNAKDLTEAEKLQARVNVTMAAGAGIAGTYEAAMGTAGKMLNSMQRYADDLKVSLGAAFGPAVTLLVDQMTGALKDANSEVRDGQSTIDAWGVKFRSAIISIEAELIRLSMLIDKVGGTMTAVLTGAGELIDVAMNIKGAVSDMYTGVDTGWVESELTKLGRTWNKVYEDRYKAGDKALQDLANLELKLTNEVKGGTSAQEQARIAAGKNGRTLVQNEETRAAALKKSEEEAKKARSASEAEAKASAREYQATLDRLEPLRVAQEEYNKGLAALDKMDPTRQTERYGNALANLKREMTDAIEQANAYKKAQEDAARASEGSELTVQGLQLQTAVSGGQITASDALPFEIDLLEKRLGLEKEYLSELQKSTPEEVTAWNSQREAVESLNTQLAEKERQLRLRDGIEGAKQGLVDFAESAKDAGSQMQSAMQDAFSGMTDALVKFVTTGKLDFSDMVDLFISDIARLAIQQSITGPIASALSGSLGDMFGGPIASAHGNVFASPGISAYSNSIVTHPTIFPFAHGIGLMGEAGAEAVMPLTKNLKGNLVGDARGLGSSDGETKALLKELIASVKGQGNTRIINTFGDTEVANAMSGAAGERVILNAIKRNPSIIQQVAR